MRVDAIIFDLDGTLHSREAAFWAWIREEAGSRELDAAPIAALDARGRGPKAALLEHLARELQWTETSLEQRLVRFRAGVLRHTRMDPRVCGMLGRLHASHRLGVVSNGSGPAQRRKLETLQLAHYFDPILISEEVGLRKPDPRIFQMAAQRWSLAADHVLVVGDDRSADVEGALLAGMQALLVAGDAPSGPQSISHITELEQWLGEQAAHRLVPPCHAPSAAREPRCRRRR